MMKKTLLTGALVLSAVAAMAQKQLYIPSGYQDNWVQNKVYGRDTLLYKESDPNATYTWSKTRSKESENFIVYWDKGYGTKAPNELSSSDFYYVDIDDLLQKAEMFYHLNVETLGFGGAPNSKVTKYKSMILLNHTTEWMAYGGGYDFMCPALWINPSTCKPVGHTIAHEIGHSFQYVCYSDYGGGSGFHFPQGQGSGWWEQTAQWQAAMAYPDLKWTESWLVYGTPYFPRAANYAMTHEWMRYQSYWWHYYLVEKYQDRSIVGKVWCHDAGTPGGEQGYDANEVLMSLKGLTVQELFKMYFEYAMKMATVDFDVDNCKEEGLEWTKNYPYTYNYVTLGGAKHQVAYSSCPQSTGFNIIPLNVPEAGTEVSTDFTSLKTAAKLADADPKQYLNGDNQYVSATRSYYNSVTNYYKRRGFRLGYVALLKDGSRRYLYEDKLYCGDDDATGAKTDTVTTTVPENTERLWLVVCPAPRAYIRHLWDENMANDDQWPYTVEFHGTNIKGAPIIDEQLPITDCTLTYNVTIPRTNDYSGATFNVEDLALSAIGTAFQMQAADINSHMVPWSAQAPTDGQIKFYALQSNGKILNSGYTTNASGHWFTDAGNRCTYQSGNGYLYSEFDPSRLAFTIGQNPGRLTVGNTYTIRQGLKYQLNLDKDNDGTKETSETALVRFIFNVTVASAGTTPTVTLASIQQDPKVDEVVGIQSIPLADNPSAPASSSSSSSSSKYQGTYNLSGHPVSPASKGLLIRNGRKVFSK